jgi:hypothetical protein
VTGDDGEQRLSEDAMIELLPETKGNLIAIKMSGTITEEDFDRYFAEANAIFNRERVEHLVFDWEHLKGWAPGARSVGTWIGMHHRALVGRVAIIADEKWADEALRITDIFKAATVRQFAPNERAAVFAWIRQGRPK